jgi:hypothetical protein
LKELKEIKKIYFQKDELLIENQRLLKDIPKPRPDYEKYLKCSIEDCQYNLMRTVSCNLLQEDLIEAMDE